MLNSFVNFKPKRILRHIEVTLSIKYVSKKNQDGDVISHMSMPKMLACFKRRETKNNCTLIDLFYRDTICNNLFAVTSSTTLFERVQCECRLKTLLKSLNKDLIQSMQVVEFVTQFYKTAIITFSEYNMEVKITGKDLCALHVYRLYNQKGTSI